MIAITVVLRARAVGWDQILHGIFYQEGQSEVPSCCDMPYKTTVVLGFLLAVTASRQYS